MTGRVTFQRYEPSYAEILAGAPVSSSRQWIPMVALANYLNGCGSQLVPACIVDRTVVSGTTEVLHFRAKTRAATVQRVWTLMLRSTSGGCVATIRAPASSGTALAAAVNSGRDVRLPIIYREILSAKASAVTDLTIDIAAAGGDIEIDSITCHELARPILTQDATDLGVNNETLRPRERIYESTGGFDGPSGVIAATISTDCRRVGIYHWSVPVSQPITTAAAYADILTLGCPVLAPIYDYAQIAAKTGTVYWSAYCKVSAGSGDIRLITSHSGTTSSVNVTTTSYAWTTATAMLIDCEDKATADGLQSSTFDVLMPSFRGVGGTMSLVAISVWSEAI